MSILYLWIRTGINPHNKLLQDTDGLNKHSQMLQQVSFYCRIYFCFDNNRELTESLKRNISVLHSYFMHYFYISGYEVGPNGQR